MQDHEHCAIRRGRPPHPSTSRWLTPVESPFFCLKKGWGGGVPLMWNWGLGIGVSDLCCWLDLLLLLLLLLLCCASGSDGSGFELPGVAPCLFVWCCLLSWPGMCANMQCNWPSRTPTRTSARSSTQHHPTAATALTWALCRAEVMSPNAGRPRRGEATPPNAGVKPRRRFLWLCFPCAARFSRVRRRWALNLMTLADSDFSLTPYSSAAAATAMPVYRTCSIVLD